MKNERLMLENEQLKRSTTTQSVSLSRDQFTKIMENEFKTKVEGIGNISTSMANLLERVENEDKQESRESLLKLTENSKPNTKSNQLRISFKW